LYKKAQLFFLNIPFSPLLYRVEVFKKKQSFVKKAKQKLFLFKRGRASFKKTSLFPIPLFPPLGGQGKQSNPFAFVKKSFAFFQGPPFTFRLKKALLFLA
jgi:hypothetical protein